MYRSFELQASAEYSMITAGANAGLFDLNDMLMETLVAIRRAGADVILCYGSPIVLKMIAMRQNC